MSWGFRGSAGKQKVCSDGRETVGYEKSGRLVRDVRFLDLHSYTISR